MQHMTRSQALDSAGQRRLARIRIAVAMVLACHCWSSRTLRRVISSITLSRTRVPSCASLRTTGTLVASAINPPTRWQGALTLCSTSRVAVPVRSSSIPRQAIQTVDNCLFVAKEAMRQLKLAHGLFLLEFHNLENTPIHQGRTFARAWESLDVAHFDGSCLLSICARCGEEQVVLLGDKKGKQDALFPCQLGCDYASRGAALLRILPGGDLLDQVAVRHDQQAHGAVLFIIQVRGAGDGRALAQRQRGDALTDASLCAQSFVAEAQRLPTIARHEVLACATREQRRHYALTVGKLDILQAIDVGGLILAQRRFLDLAEFAEGDKVAVFVIGLDGQDRDDLFARAQLQQLAQRLSFGRARPQRDAMCGDLKDTSAGGDAEQVVLRGRGDDLA